MTPNTFSSPVAKTSSSSQATAAAIEVATAEQLLRDMAYVLKLTRRVKDEMMADRVPAQNPAGIAEGVLVA